MVSETKLVGLAEGAEQSVAAARDRLLTVKDSLSKVLIGQDEVIDNALICMLAGGHVLLEGTPGLGKTLFIKALAKITGLSMRRLQFTPDLMPSDILGGERLTEVEGGVVPVFRKGPVFTQILLADEVNRANPRTQSALLEAMGEGHVTVAGETLPLPSPFLVFASQNPVEMQGTYPLPEAQTDRFMMCIKMQRPAAAVLPTIMTIRTEALLRELQSQLNADTIEAYQRMVAQVPAASNVLQSLANLIESTWQACQRELHGRLVGMGASPRAAQDLFRASQARALVSGRMNVTLEDVRMMSSPVLTHRLILPMAVRAEGVSVETLLTDLATRTLS